MNILHMSDLHLGRRFYNLSFLPIQQALLQEVLQIIDDQQVTVLLLCGDIYDKPVPPADAVQLLDWFLTQLAARSVHVFMISGNHDSPERLQFGSDLLQKNQIHIAGTFSGKMETVSLSDDYGTLTISMLPYVKLLKDVLGGLGLDPSQMMGLDPAVILDDLFNATTELQIAVYLKKM